MSKENNGEAETRNSLAEGHGITFPNAEKAIKWLKSEDKMTAEKELAEKIAGCVLRFAIDYYNFQDIREEIIIKGIKSHPYHIDQILALIKQAGYKSPEEISQLALDYQLGVFDGRRLEKETMLANGYVKLAENQTLPECLVGNRPRAKAFRDMLNAGLGGYHYE